MIRQAYCVAIYCMVVVCGLRLSMNHAVAQTVSVDLLPAAQEVVLGDSVDVDLVISGLGAFAPPSLGVFDLDIMFDPAILSFQSAVFGDELDHSGLGSITQVLPGVMNINMFELSLDNAADLDALQPGSFKLATLTLDAVAVGTSSLTLSIHALGDADGERLEAAPGRSQVTVIADTVLPNCNGVSATLVGTDKDNILNGTAGDDVIVGGGGNDTINGRGGNDIICGEAGDDTLIGGEGDDELHGGSGNDILLGQAGNDVLRGGRGDDSLRGGSGDDLLFGDGDNDLLLGKGGNDTLHGGSGDDVVSGGSGDDVVNGDSGDDLLLGDGDNDLLRGHGGHDTLRGGSGDDDVRGGGGDDVVRGGSGLDTCRGGTGTDTAMACEAVVGIP